MNCPNCNSGNTKTFQMVYMSGTRNDKSNMKGVGVSTSGNISLGVGGGSTTSQSLLAANCQPPKISQWPKVGLFALVVFVWLPLISAMLNSFSAPSFLQGLGTFIASAVLFGLATYAVIKLFNHIRFSGKEKLHKYANSWLCLKCGTSFLPYGFKTISDSNVEVAQLTKQITEDLEQRKKEQSKSVLVSDTAFTPVVNDEQLMTCLSCGNQVSKSAIKCRHCGNALNGDL